MRPARPARPVASAAIPAALPLAAAGAFLILMALPLVAQEAVIVVPADEIAILDDPASAWISSRSIEGADIYTLAEAYDEGFWNTGGDFDAIAADWEEIGDVEGVVISRDGVVIGVTVEVGGFLGIGQRRVLLDLADIRLTQRADDDDLIVVTRLNRDQLQDRDDIGDLFGDD